MGAFPRMVFRSDDDARVVHDADQMAAALADGYCKRWIPSDGPRPEQVDAPITKEPAHVGDDTPEPKKRGRPAKPKE